MCSNTISFDRTSYMENEVSARGVCFTKKNRIQFLMHSILHGCPSMYIMFSECDVNILVNLSHPVIIFLRLGSGKVCNVKSIPICR